MPTAELIDGLLDLAPVRLANGDRGFAEQAAQRLAELPHHLVERGIEEELERAVSSQFRSGWQPAELERQARRNGGSSHASLAASAILAHHTRWTADSLDTRWQRQVDALLAASAEIFAIDGPHGWLAGWSASIDLDRPSTYLSVFEVLVMLRSLPPLDELIPPPGAPSAVDRSGPGDSDLSEADRRLLERVRLLLGKAESTGFDAEAEAFTAKAHELITRHAIDMALIAGSRDGASEDRPVSTRIDIDDPYADAKSLLLQVVAEANRCRTVFHSRLSLTTVLGFPTDVAATELLFTSLLVQGQTALAAAGRSAPPGARTRSRSFRSAFLVAFANRIGQRLDDINRHIFDDGPTDSAALPVLRSRRQVVDDVVTERFPELTASTVRGGRDAAGWVGGRLAADQARLNFADLADDLDDVDPAAPPALAAG